LSWIVDSVRAASLTPDRRVLHVGEELECSASGNPTPRLTFGPAEAVAAAAGGGGEGQRFGVAWKRLVVPAKWKDKSQTVTCTAVNELDGEQHTDTVSATFDVAGEYTTRTSHHITSHSIDWSKLTEADLNGHPPLYPRNYFK